MALVAKLRRAGAADEALAICQDLSREQSGDVQPLLLAAEICEEAARFEDAVRHLQAVIEIDRTALDVHDRLAGLLDKAGRPEDAVALRRETMRAALDAAAGSQQRIQADARYKPIYEADEHRLEWAGAVLHYTAAGCAVARHHVAQGDVDGGRKHYTEMLRTLAGLADQASAVDGLRRTFETAAQAFSQCHFELGLLHDAVGNLGGAVYHLEEAWRARRSPSPEARAKLGEVALRCAPDIAGIRDAVAAYHGKMPAPAAVPITRWDFRRHAAEWLAAVDQRREDRAPGEARRIAIPAFNAHHIQVFFALACVLLARGHEVDLLWLPCLEFDRPCDPEPRYEQWDEVLLAHEVTAFAASDLPPGLRILDLRDVEPAPMRPDFQVEAVRLAFIDLRNQYRDASIDTAAEPMRTRYANRIAKNLDAMRRMARYVEETAPDHVILFNGGVMEYGAAFHAARGAGVRVVEWEQSAHRRGDFVLSINRCHGDLDMTQIWDADAPHALTDARTRRVSDWLLSKDPASSTSREPRGRFAPEAEAKRLIAELGLDPEKPVAALFPNLTWDTSALDREVAFASVQDWVLQTAAFFAAQSDWQLVVRIHPAEQVRSQEHIGEIIRTHFSPLPETIRIVESESSLSSYRLLDAAQLGLYYTGTLGLEMTMLGIQAVTPAWPLYGGFGFTREAATPDAYFEMIRRGFADPDGTALTQQEIDLSWCFADLYMTQTPKPFPWSYQQFWPSIQQDWPMDRVLSSNGETAFGKVFAVFAGEVDLPDGIVGALNDRDL